VATLLLVKAKDTSIILKLPASLIKKHIEPIQEVKLDDYSGSIWNGSAQKLSVKVKTGYIDIGQLSWSLKLSCIFTLKACADITISPTPSSNGDIQMTSTVMVNKNKLVTLKNTDADIDAKWVLEMAGAPISATGVLKLLSDSIVLDQSQALPSITGNLSWQNAAIDYPEEYELGAFSIELETEGTDQQRLINGVLSDQNGLIETNGTLLLNAQKLLKTDLRLSPNERTPESISDLMMFIGQPDKNGNYRIRQQTSLRTIL